MKKFSFHILNKLNSKYLARAGVISTLHGEIQTPAFIAAATKATTKALTSEQVKGLGAQAVLANTYHLYLRPGSQIVKKAGGLHEFMNWPGPIVTDSGGFQVFSLGEAFGQGVSKIAGGRDGGRASIDERKSAAKKAKITANGVTFWSHIDGSKHELTPEKSMQIQHDLGADIILAFDECTSPQADKAYQKEALNRTHDWAARSLTEHKELSKKSGTPQALFGVVQGGRHEDLRRLSAKTIGGMDFDGFGIGGSFNKDDMGTAVRWVNEELPEDKPRHLLGIGEPVDLFEGVENGVDTFDCVNPTRLARTGTVYTHTGRLNLGNAGFVQDFTPIEESCACYTCQNYTRAYLSHLIRSEEMLAATLLSIHNLHFVVGLVDQIRSSILDGTFLILKQSTLENYYNN